MLANNLEWLPLDLAATWYGYGHPESFRQRLRQLRQHGDVVDIGKPPKGYDVSESGTKEKIVIMWPNPKTALIRSDAPKELLNPKRGKRTKAQR